MMFLTSCGRLLSTRGPPTKVVDTPRDLGTYEMGRCIWSEFLSTHVSNLRCASIGVSVCVTCLWGDM